MASGWPVAVGRSSAADFTSCARKGDLVHGAAAGTHSSNIHVWALSGFLLTNAASSAVPNARGRIFLPRARGGGPFWQEIRIKRAVAQHHRRQHHQQQQQHPVGNVYSPDATTTATWNKTKKNQPRGSWGAARARRMSFAGPTQWRHRHIRDNVRPSVRQSVSQSGARVVSEEEETE